MIKGLVCVECGARHRPWSSTGAGWRQRIGPPGHRADSFNGAVGFSFGGKTERVVALFKAQRFVKPLYALLVGALVFLAACGAAQPSSGGAPAAGAREKVLVRFTWKLKGEYAPLFMALDKGYYAAEGLDVSLEEGSGAQTVTTLLGSGKEHFGYGPAVAAAQAVSTGVPVTVVALYQAAAPMGVIAFPEVPLKSPKDLEGRKIGTSVGETFTDMLPAFATKNNIDLNKITRIQMDNSARSTEFLSKHVDMMSVYLNNELPQLEQKTGVKFNVLRVADFGFSLPGAAIFADAAYARANPTIVSKLIRATNKGFVEAKKDPQAAADIMAKHMTVKDDPAVTLAQVKATVDATNAPSAKPIGWMTDQYWQDNLKLLQDTKAITTVKDLKEYYTNDYNK